MKTLTQTLTTAAVALVLALGAAAATSTISYADDTPTTPADQEQAATPDTGNENEGAEADKDTTPSTTTDQTLTRLYGNEAYDTAAKIALEAYKADDWTATNPKYDTCENVVIANSNQFADAMSAAGLAGALNAPILLTPKDNLSNNAADAITTLGAKNIYVIGGINAIDENTFEQLENLTGIENVYRIFGNDSWNTSAECAKTIAELDTNNTAKGKYAIVATSDSFQDAVSISSFAYAYHIPIFLNMSNGELDDDALISFVNDYPNLEKIFVVGGSSVVDRSKTSERIANFFRWDKDERENKIVDSLWGTTAYDTSLAIADYLTTTLGADGQPLMQTTTATVASGNEGCKGLDALAGAALAGKKQSVILLADTADKDGTTAVSSFIKTNDKTIKDKYILGGTSSISDDITKTYDADHKHTYTYGITATPTDWLTDIVEDTEAWDEELPGTEMKSKYVCNIHGDTIVQTDEQAAETGIRKGGCSYTLDYETWKNKETDTGTLLTKDTDGACYLKEYNQVKQQYEFICMSAQHSVDYYVPVEHSGQFEHHDAITHEEVNTAYPTAYTLTPNNTCSCGHTQDATTSTCNHDWQPANVPNTYTYSRTKSLEEFSYKCTTIEGKQGPVTDPRTGDVYLGIIKEEVENGTHYDYKKYNAATNITATPKKAKYCPICGMWDTID